MAEAKKPRAQAPKQERSRRTERAIADAVDALLLEKPFDRISVAEIAQRAGISVGGFYARFPSKTAVLHAIERALFDDFLETARTTLDEQRWAGQGIRPIVQAYVLLMVGKFRERRLLILQLMRFAKSDPDSERRLRAFNTEIHDRMRALLLARRDEITAADPERAVNLALFMSSAAAREAVLTRNLSMYPVRLTDEELAAEIATAFHAYLTAI